MEEAIGIVAEVGFPIAISLVAGVFIFVSVNHILNGILDQLKFLNNILKGMENRVSTMNNDTIRIDITVCNVLGIRPDIDRVARAKGKTDARND